MKIDGQDVFVGDSVWHDRYGVGQVVRVSVNTCDIKFSQGSNPILFTEGGKQRGIKTVWWQKPFIHAPKKGVNYNAVTPIIEANFILYESLYH